MHEFEVIVIGGGATGAGIARDAAMRKFKTLLIERGTAGSGTSGRYHGLLHSGGRYAVEDPESAKECIQENIILKKIAGRAIDDTGGYFVTTADDDLNYSETFFTTCKQIGIPIDEIPVGKALQKEPQLQPTIARVFSVPDAVCDSQMLITMNLRSAQEHGAKILTHHEVVGFAIANNQIAAVHVKNVRSGEQTIIACRFVINAAGVWAGNVTRLAEISFSIAAVKGSMVVTKKRSANTVLNRTRPADDGDIIVPKNQSSIIGTTSIRITNPDHLITEPWEVALLLKEGEKLIKDFSKQSLLYTYAGVRPLFNETATDQTRKIKRTFTLRDHKKDGLNNMLTIVGGKLTTYRAMAQATVDAMCRSLHVTKDCTTMKELLPRIENQKHRFPFYDPTNAFQKPHQSNTSAS